MAEPHALGFKLVVTDNRIGQVPAAIHAAVAREIERSARQIEAASKQKCPVLTGTLRRSIHTVLADGGMKATVGPSVDYGIYVELGTRHRGARPYLRPAAELELPLLVDNLKRALGSIG